MSQAGARGSTSPGVPEVVLQDLLSFPAISLSQKQLRTIQWDKEGWIVDQLTRKRFRRGPLHPDTLKDVRAKVGVAVASDTPIYLILCFGGYKHYWNRSYPDVDFAELFNIRFMMDFVAPITRVHEPGVILDYESDDAVVTLIDNYPRSALEGYADSFRTLLAWYQACAKPPGNLKLSLVRPQEQEELRQRNYEAALLRRIEELRPQKADEWARLDPKERESRLARTGKSIMWSGERDLTRISAEERDRLIVQSKMDNEIYYEADAEFREAYFTGGTHIPIVQSWGLCYENTGHWLTMASTYASTVDFWIGRGVLRQRGDRFIPLILSHSQYESAETDLRAVKSLSWQLPPPARLKNFSEIEVIRQDPRMPP